MPDYILAANGNASSAAVWAVTNATAFLHSEAANTVLTTAYVESATFTPGAITIDGIAVKVARRVASPTGTISIRLAQAGATVAGTEVTINVSDIPYGVGLVADSQHNGWIFFKFSAPVLLLAATLYTVSAKTSSASQVHLYRNATAGNWSRRLRTTTLAALAAADTFSVLGEWTAAATVTNRSVTWDITAATDFGDASITLSSVSIGVGGTMTYGVTAATTYIMRLSGLLDVCVGGTLNMGTTGTPCPRDSSMRIEFDSLVDGDFGLRVYGTWNAQGQSRIAASVLHYVLLNTDEAIGQTTLGVNGQLSARNGDVVAIASTSRTNTEAETVTMAADAGASTLTTGATAVAHLGTDPTQAEVICLNRDVRIVAVTSTLMAYVLILDTAIVDCDWVEFRYLGVTTAGKRGVEIQTVTGSANFDKCSLRDFDNHGFLITSTDNWTNIHIRDCVGYNIAANGAFYYQNTSTTGTNWTVSGNVFIMDRAAADAGIHLRNYGGVVTNNRMTSGGVGFNLAVEGFITGTFSGNVAHSNQGVGLANAGAVGGTFGSFTSWRNSSNGMTGTGTMAWSGTTIEDYVAFGNTPSNFALTTGVEGLILRRMLSNGDATFSTVTGLHLQAGAASAIHIRFEECNFSTASGIKTAHTQDVNLVTGHFIDLAFVNTLLLAATEILNIATFAHAQSRVSYQKQEGASGTNKTNYPRLGVITMDAVTFRTAAPSEKLEPVSATVKLPSGPKRVPVASGQTCTISTYVNKGATYNGSAPRLRVLCNAAAGIAEATVATHASAAGSFVQMTGAVGPVSEDCVLEFYVDGDGTVGQVNVDDWSYTVA